VFRKRSTTENSRSKTASRRKNRRRSFFISLALLLFCLVLLYAAWYSFAGRKTDDSETAPDMITAEEDKAETETETEIEAEKPEPEAVEDGTETVGEDATETFETNLKVVADGNYPLALVTKETTLKSNYAPSDLRQIPDYMHPARELWLREEPLARLEALWQAASDDGVLLTIISAYRSYDYQKTLFQNYADNYGEEAANRFSARAGQSEHQLGTTVDFGGTAVDLNAAYAETDQGRWLAENAYRFGFAMSYPEGKETVTGYIFEPWHYRYIGLQDAQEWYLSGLSLKEFLETKPQNFE
jgi:zinc D-Ala-D-Ala carboxypeptidase